MCNLLEKSLKQIFFKTESYVSKVKKDARNFATTHDLSRCTLLRGKLDRTLPFHLAR